MNKKILSILLAMLICTTAIAPAIAQPTPFVIDGYVYDSNGNPCNDPAVQITNTNMGVSWSATTSTASNRYQLILDSDDVSVDDLLQLATSGCSQSNTTEHTVTESEINAGGFSQDISLEPAAEPDLVITEKYEELLENGTFTVTYTVCNQGGDDADESNTTITIDGVDVLEDPVPALPAGENYTNTVGPFNCSCGMTVNLTVCADNDDAVAESDETNNCLENEFACPPCKLDLTVTAIETPARLRAEVSNPVSATVENVGPEDAENFDVTLEADGTVVDTVTVTSLNASESTTVEFLWTPSEEGNCTLNVTADTLTAIEESDETNNSLTKDVAVLPKLTATANIRIESKNETVWTGTVTFSNSTVTTTDGVTHYLNEPTALGALDEANKSGGFGYVLVDYGWGLYVEEVAGEPPIGWDGWMYRVDYVSPWMGAADFVLNVTTPPATPHEDVLWYFGAWTAPPLKIELEKTTVEVEEEFVAAVTAYNDTTGLFDPVSEAGVYVDGVLYNLTAPDGTVTLLLEAAGDYQIHADKGTWADYIRSEQDTVTVVAVSKPDLTVAAIETPARLRADVINPISAVVENTGSADATSFDVTLEADGTVVDTVTVASLNVSESKTVEFLWTPSQEGNYTLNVTVDANDDVEESNETNNSLTEDVTVLDKLTATANVRIEGKNDTVWYGTVTFRNSTVTTTDGVTHYLNEPTALGALDEADKLGGFGYVLVDYGWGLYVSEIAGEPPIGWDGWMYRVDYTSPWVGAADFVLNVTTPPATPHEDVLWYFGAWTAPPLKIELDKTVVNVSENFIATVTAYNDTSVIFEPVDNATVFFDGLTFQTGADGNATLSINNVGSYTVYVDKGTWKEYTRSEKKAVTVLSVESYGDSIYYKKNVRLAWRALGEPNRRGAILFRNAKIAIELEQTIPACKNVSVWVRKIGFRPASFDVAVSSDGENWTTIGSETCNSRRWARYDFNGDRGDVKYIRILKPGASRRPRIMALDAVHAEN